MGMTIEELKGNLSYAIKWKDRPTDESMMLAIKIIRKYQKIQEFMAKRPKDMISSNPTLRAIGEVIEDGNVD